MDLARLSEQKRLPLAARIAVTSPQGEYAAAAVVLSSGLILLTSLLPGAAPVPAIAALAVFLVGSALGARALSLTYPHDRLGACNAITLLRLALSTALIAPVLASAGPSWTVFAVALIALTLDGVDGWLARRQGHVSDFGARFDMEVDSLFALVLSLGAAATSAVGPAALVLGLPRYLFLAAAWRFSWMRRNLPERFSRKAVCVLQLGALIALQAPSLPEILALTLVPVVILALVWSFAVDILWLWRRRP